MIGGVWVVGKSDYRWSMGSGHLKCSRRVEMHAG